MREGEKAWFGPKAYGVGFSPVSWEGWLLTAALVVWLGGGIRLILDPSLRADRFMLFVPWLAGVALLIWLVRRKTRGDIRWRWGGRR